MAAGSPIILTTAVNGPINLAPLGYYGGPTQTMPPLAGSPAIDGSVGSIFTTDQRGVAIAGVPDIGAVENGSRVTTPVDQLDTPAGPSVSLREAVRDCPAGGVIDFAPALSGAVTLTTALGGEVVLGKSVTMDASNLTGGVTIDGGTGTNRIFSENSGQTVLLQNLTLTGGGSTGAASSGTGGAILNKTGGTLSLTRCTLVGNSCTINGGGINNTATGTLTVTACTFTGNTAGQAGGAINSQGPMTARRSTFFGNTATLNGGGAIRGESSTGNLTLEHCALVGNNAAASGGGILRATGSLSIANCIVTGNTDGIAGTASNNLSGTITQTGANLTSGDALLAPLADYGGPTQTMALLPGSPARNAATLLVPAITSNQRGFPIGSTPDIGAYEAGTLSNFAAWSLETVGTALVFNADTEGDGITEGIEYATRTSVGASTPNPFPTPGQVTLPGNVTAWQSAFQYRPEATDVRYIVQRSVNLPAWTEIYRYDKTNNTYFQASGETGTINPGNGTVTVVDSAFAPDKTFWRLVVERP